MAIDLEKYRITPTIPSGADIDLSKYKIAPTPTPAPQQSLADRIWSSIAQRGTQAAQDVTNATKGTITPMEGATRAVGQAGGVIGDITGHVLSAITPDFIKSIVGEGARGAKGLITAASPEAGKEIDILTNAHGAYQTWAQANPRAAKNLEAVVNVGQLIAGAAGITKATSEVSPLVKEGVSAVGSGISKAGESLYKTGITPTVDEAKLIQSYNASRPSIMDKILGNGDHIATDNPTVQKPVLRANTALEKGIAGTESMIGRQATRTSRNLWTETIQPALEQSTGEVSKVDMFAPVEKRIAETAEPTKRAAYERAYEALKEDYKNTPFSFPDLQAQKIKEGLDRYTPARIFKGQDVVSEMRTLQNDMANGIRAKIYSNLSDVNIKKAYRDYGNLTELSKIGVKSISEAGRKAGFGSFVSFLWDKATTPIKTVGGKVLYKIGNSIQFEGEPGVKTFGDFMQSNGYENPNTIGRATQKEISATQVPPEIGKSSPSDNLYLPKSATTDEIKTEIKLLQDHLRKLPPNL